VYRKFAILSVSVFVLASCSSLPRQHAVPKQLTTQAVVATDLGDVRYLVDNPDDMRRMSHDAAELWPKELAWQVARGKSDTALAPSNILAISGGGDNGAYAAGFLNGWSATGTRPEFSLVTGVSTGALIAPYAFLGSAHDAELKEFYTETPREKLIEIRDVFAVLTEDSIIDTAPLCALISKQIDQAFLDKIAAEYRKGRTLLISTTNLDTRQNVIWDMTKIAASQDPRALDLFHSIMLASAAIPGAFPPVMINVEVNGQVFSEMHVDGGTSGQVFVYPPSLNLGALAKENGGQRKRALFVIMNERIDPEWAETERNVLTIAGRAVATLIHNQGIGDLFRIYLTTQRDHVAFNLSYIPADFNHPNAGVFNADFMRTLYTRGYKEASQGQPWQHFPPGYTPDTNLAGEKH
jgi:predicted patatin/cPLA2 family phospholipase